ncbi:MAG TPA: hypothetical protein VL977_07780 [Solirubrobacteraceae bacterium]|nr:hypothetical protein [Solirubrobacteraceae bacterium]
MLVAGSAIAVIAGGSAAASLPNVSGTWSSVYVCQSGGCAGSSYPDTLTLKQASGSSTVTGTDDIDGSLNGTLTAGSGGQAVLKMTETDGSYTADFDVTVTFNGSAASWSGTLTDSNGTSGTDTATLEQATLAKTGEAKAVSGTVLVEQPGSSTFAPLSGTSTIPMGSTVDATNGTVAITVAEPHGKTQSGDFYDGEFKLTQSHSGLTTETLSGGDFSTCTSAAGRLAHAASSSPKGQPVRELWGHAHGKFATSGRGGAATVLGTIWLTEDYCNGTLFKAVKDSVTVVDFAHPRQKHVIAQGHSYFAPAGGS